VLVLVLALRMCEDADGDAAGVWRVVGAGTSAGPGQASCGSETVSGKEQRKKGTAEEAEEAAGEMEWRRGAGGVARALGKGGYSAIASEREKRR
jgi:hypothetical protein